MAHACLNHPWLLSAKLTPFKSPLIHSYHPRYCILRGYFLFKMRQKGRFIVSISHWSLELMPSNAGILRNSHPPLVESGMIKGTLHKG